MTKSKRIFLRWQSYHGTTWPYLVFKKYNEELMRILKSQELSSKYVYTHLATDGGKWDDYISSYFSVRHETKITLKQWSDTNHLFENWNRLNALMSLSSYFETYLSSVISLAIESDPGVLLGSHQSVDGVKLLKTNSFKKEQFESVITSCTKGDWTARKKNIENLFGTLPASFSDNNGISKLNAMRKLRNNVAHAFGRDIEESRKYEKTTILPMGILSKNRLSEWMSLIKKITKDFDHMLLQNHIGAFQPILFYHNLYPSLNNKDTPKARDERMKELKKALGRITQESYGKEFCSGLIKYYEEL